MAKNWPNLMIFSKLIHSNVSYGQEESALLDLLEISQSWTVLQSYMLNLKFELMGTVKYSDFSVKTPPINEYIMDKLMVSFETNNKFCLVITMIAFILEAYFN